MAVQYFQRMGVDLNARQLDRSVRIVKQTPRAISGYRR